MLYRRLRVPLWETCSSVTLDTTFSSSIGYSGSRTINLEYLDLADTAKPKLSEVANNVGVIFDRVSILSKVSLKHFYSLKEEIRELRHNISSILQKAVSSLEKELISRKPLTQTEVRNLVREISQQPKLVKEEALKLTEELRKGVRKVEYLIEEIKQLIGG
ncbi:hypothetical protein ZIOFF_014212 [Zingiber officinale]|uniref:Uncharacterized protein n=1 Tax=Zingiber officinale TaxID=94328 RepID=A0A8J5HH07_ZINOF|nr:hypothetical protein ZIOFF_014212 [Zingiber officinale]